VSSLGRMIARTGGTLALCIGCVAFGWYGSVVLARRSVTRGAVAMLQRTNLRDVEATYTVVAFVRPTCEYCSASMPLLRELTGTAVSTRSWRVIIVSDEPIAITKAYVAQFGVSPDDVRSASFAELRVAAIPTIWLVDHEGDIVGRVTGSSLRDSLFVKRQLGAR
jgi:thioredoxin-related protein